MLDNPFDEDLVGKEDRYWAQQVIDKGILSNITSLSLIIITPNGNTWKGIG